MPIPISCWKVSWAPISDQHSGKRPKLSVTMRQTQTLICDQRSLKATASIVLLHPENLEQVDSRTHKLLSIKMTTWSPVAANSMSPHSHQLVLGGSYFVGKHAVSHTKFEHQPQGTLLMLRGIFSRSTVTLEMCLLKVLLTRDSCEVTLVASSVLQQTRFKGSTSL